MKFKEFEYQIERLKSSVLAGEQIHLAMAPIERILELKKLHINKSTVKKAAVLMLFYPDTSGIARFALILRKTSKGVHSGQVGFPGGKFEAEDVLLCNTALRETEEEIGVSKNAIHLFKELTEIYIPPSNFWVHPFLGFSEKTPEFVLQDSEVESLIEVKLSQFLDDDIHITETLSTSYATSIQVPAFQLNNFVVWGATAMILNEVRHLLKEVF